MAEIRMNNHDFIFEYIVKPGLKPKTYDKVAGSSHYSGFYSACKKFGLSIHKHGEHYLISNSRKRTVGILKDMKSSQVSLTASSICNDKILTNLILAKSQVPVPRQLTFDTADSEEIHQISFYPVVLKPVNGRGGKSVFVGIESEDELLNLIRKECKTKTAKSATRWIIEEHLIGFDVRVTVVGNRFSCACVRIPPFVIGDGISTIQKLVVEKNTIRATHPHHKRFPIKISDSVAEKVPEKKEVYLLSNIANIHQGGEAFDVSDLMCEELKILAEDAVRAVPGLMNAGVDLMTGSLHSKSDARVLELNTASNYEIHYYPYYGEQRNPAEDVIICMLNGS